MISLTRDEWAPIIAQTHTRKVKDMRATEVAFDKFLDQFGEDGNNILLSTFVENSPPMIRDLPHDARLLIMLIIVKRLSKHYHILLWRYLYYT